MDPERVKSRTGKSKDMRPPKKVVPSEAKRIHLPKESKGEVVEKSRGRAVEYSDRDTELLQSLRKLNDILGGIKSKLAARASRGEKESHDRNLEEEMRRLTESVGLLTTGMDYKPPGESDMPKSDRSKRTSSGTPLRGRGLGDEFGSGSAGQSKSTWSKPEDQSKDESLDRIKTKQPMGGSAKKSPGTEGAGGSPERQTFEPFPTGAPQAKDSLSKDLVKEDLFRESPEKPKNRKASEEKEAPTIPASSIPSERKASPLEESKKKEALGANEPLSFAGALGSKTQEALTDPQKYFSQIPQKKNPSLSREKLRPVRRERDSIKRETKPETKKGRARQGGQGTFREGVKSYKRKN
jgi:hypothetical protein